MDRRVLVSVSAAVALVVGVLAAQAPAPNIRSALIDAPAMLADLKLLSADDMEGRRIGTQGAAKARAVIEARFKTAGLLPFGATYRHPFTTPPRRGGMPGIEGINVVGHLDGPRTPKRYIVLTAHYDHVGVRNGQVFNGADDNASGTAALAAIAAYFRAHPLSNSLIVAAFDGEESGLLGSQAFMKSPPVDRGALAINVNLDMIGRDPANTLYAVGTTRQPWLRSHVERVAARAPVKLLMGHDKPGSGPDDWTMDSDHWTFLQAGIPALYLGVDDEKHHHQPTDDYESMTYGFYVAAVETAIRLIEELDANLDQVMANRRQ